VPTFASRARRASAVTIALAVGFAGALIAAPAANAATFSVTSTNDAGPGSLRQAVLDANASAGFDTITIALTFPATSIFIDSTIVVTDGVHLQGPGAAALLISRSGDFEILEFNMASANQDVVISGINFDGGSGTTQRGLDFLDVVPVRTLAIQSAEFANFVTTVRGGAINIDGLTGNFFLNDTDIHDNTSTGNADVPSLYAEDIETGFVSISSSDFYQNTGASGAGVMIVSSSADIAINDSTFDDNQTTSFGGAAFFETVGSLTIRRTSFDNDSSSSSGGALWAATISGSVEIEDSSFSNSSSPTDGGAIAVRNVGGLSIIDSTFTSNTSGVDGGAVWANLTGETTVSGSAFSLNTAVFGGALSFTDLNDTVAIVRSTFDQNTATGQGGAIFVEDVDNVVYLESDSFTANTTGVGSAFEANSVVDDLISVNNSTFSGNISSEAASFRVGSIASGTAVQFANSTFVEDAPTSDGIIGVGTNEGGLYVLSSTLIGNGVLEFGVNDGDALVSHSILDGDANGLGDDVINVNGTTLADLEYSIVTTAFDGANMNSLAGNQFSTDPQLGALAFNGGPTRTMLPAAGSPAINAGDPLYSTTLQYPNDQRGDGFVREYGRVDIGAVEVQLVTLAATGLETSPLVPIGAASLLLLGAAASLFVRRRRTA